MRTGSPLPLLAGDPRRRLGYRPILDGLRALAIVLVFMVHTPYGKHLPGGFIGLDIFLALSGFLITSLLIEEKEISGRISLRSFYMRRALRILPAISALLLIYVVGALLRADEPLRSSMLHGAAKAATYQSNLVLASGEHLAELGHTWSLSFEEQFYAVWPLALIALFVFIGSRRGIMWVTAGAIVAVTCLRLYLWARGASWQRIYYAPDTRADALLAGCLAAQVFYWTSYPERFRKALRSSLVIILLSLVPFLFVVDAEWREMAAGPMTLIAFAMAILVLGAVTAASPSLRSLLEHRASVVVGRLSYSLYIWHVPIFLYMQRHYPGRLPFPRLPLAAKTAVALTLTFAAATASYYIIELPFLRLKRRFARVEKPPVEEIGLAVESRAGARGAGAAPDSATDGGTNAVRSGHLITTLEVPADAE